MSTTLTQLINLLTRPLIFTYPAITVVQLQLALQANLSNLFNTQAFAPFTLHLSAHTLPIPQIYAACLSLGLNWEEWVVALSSGKDLYVFIMQGCIRVGVPGTKETVVVWEEEEKETKALTASKLHAILDSSRARKQANAQTNTLPTLRITPSTPLLPSPSEPSSPVSTTSLSSSSSSSASDMDSDSDSDSDTESTFSSYSSHSSQSSVSSNFTKACSNAFDTPFLIPTTTTLNTTTTTSTKGQTTRAIPRAQRRREWVAQASLSPASAPRTQTDLNANATITKYTYQGGQTGVMTGGVMLGGSGVVVAATTRTGTITMNLTSSGSGSDSANWRRGSMRI